VRQAILLTLLALMACRGDVPKEGSSASEATPSAPTPVRIAAVSRADLPVFVSGPGKTTALNQQKIRAPFAGTLTELSVSDGDPVRRGQRLGSIVARDTEAALSGAREMLRDARNDAERRDAERALALAEKSLVRRTLVATSDGAVLSHAASTGDKVAEDQEILTLDDPSSIVFLADLPQADLPRIAAGQRARIEIAGQTRPLEGTVHAVLPGANPVDFTGSVRIEFLRPAPRLAVGIFGTAAVLVSQHRGATVVPEAAVLRDDVSGVSRVAVVDQNRAHWVNVTSGLRQQGLTEILAPALAPGQRVIVSGQVGLPEGKLVAPQS
jgi:HlyD family secretion protein